MTVGALRIYGLGLRRADPLAESNCVGARATGREMPTNARLRFHVLEVEFRAIRYRSLVRRKTLTTISIEILASLTRCDPVGAQLKATDCATNARPDLQARVRRHASCETIAAAP